MISQLLNLLSINNTSWAVGIESINDLIYTKKQDGSVLSDKTSDLILNWIDSKYDNKIFEGFSGSYHGDDEESKNLVFIMELTLDTVFYIRHSIDVLPFLNSKLENSLSEYESWVTEHMIEMIKQTKLIAKQEISNNILNHVLLRVDDYFESKYKAKKDSFLLCGLRESIREHRLCYSIDWCKESEKYLSRVKQSVSIGAGALMISKVSDKFQMMGSSPGIDWLNLFELKIQDLEEYFCLEIPYKKENVSKLKSVLKCSTNELVNMVKNQEKIVYTEAKGCYGDSPSFQEIADDLNKYGIYCKVEIKTRKKATNETN